MIQRIQKLFTFKNVLYLGFLLIFTLLVVELLARYYLGVVLQKSANPKFQFDSYRIYAHVPGFHEGDGKKDWIIINDQGFRRSQNVSKEKPENVFRIFFLGGSAAHGISSAAPYPIRHIYQNETVDAYLEAAFAKKYPHLKIEVINAAVTGYQVFQHTAYILSELLDYKPDMVVFFDGANDHYFHNQYYDYYGDNRYQFWKNRLREPSLSGMFDYCALWLSEYSAAARGYFSWRLIKDAQNNFIEVNTVLPKEPDKIIKAHQKIAEQQYLRSVKTNIQILKSNGIDVIVCLQPMLVLRNKDHLSTEEKGFLHVDKAVESLYPIVLKELHEVCDSNNVQLVDINPKFNEVQFSGKQLLIDYCHLSPLGGEVAANAIFPYIDKEISNKISIK